MKKNIKAIIAALSASVMCAVPVAASLSTTAVTASITASAADDIIKDATLISTNNGEIVITNGAITYRITGSNTAELYGRYNQVSDVHMADQIRYNGRLYKVTKVRAYAFKNAHRTATGSGVTKFRCGKYVTEIGDQAFYESSVSEVDLHSADALEIIGNEAFACASVSPDLYIPSKVKEIRSGAFRYNRWLETVTIDGGYNYITGENYNLIPIKIATNAFKDCNQLYYFAIYRRYPKNGWGSTAPDPTVLAGTDVSTGDVHGNVYGVPVFKQIFFPHN